jgi:hypothetical protein
LLGGTLDDGRGHGSRGQNGINAVNDAVVGLDVVRPRGEEESGVFFDARRRGADGEVLAVQRGDHQAVREVRRPDLRPEHVVQQQLARRTAGGRQ